VFFAAGAWGLVRMLEAYDFEIAAAVESGPELTRALAELAPDVAVVDVRLPPSHTDEGLQCALQARRERPGLPVLVLSPHVEQLYARELLADGTGRVGYLLEDRVFDAEQFIDAVRRVAAGGTAMDPQVIQQLLSRRSHTGRPLGRLTPRELELLELMAPGAPERGDRGPTRGHRTGDRQTHLQHLHQTGAGGLRRRQPARTRRTGIFGSRQPLKKKRPPTPLNIVQTCFSRSTPRKTCGSEPITPEMTSRTSKIFLGF
jgi:DNA-binding NarL/FixJ family response regulator